MEQYFSNLFEVIRHERSLILPLSLAASDILKQSKFTDDEKKYNKKFCSRKITPSKTFEGIFCYTIIRTKYFKRLS